MNQCGNDSLFPGGTYNQRIYSLFETYITSYSDEQERLKSLGDEFAKGSDIRDRKRLPGHVTASGIVYADKHMLMIFHPTLSKWLQPGGHIDPFERPVDAAKREVFEETGFHCLENGSETGGTAALLLDIDVHRIPQSRARGEPEHWHYDFRYLLTPLGGRHACVENHRSMWQPASNVREPNLKRVIKKLEART